MRNGIIVAIDPGEGLVASSVGWQCWRNGVWEHHIEAALVRALHAGDVAYDVGANLGYFSGVMARLVGVSGVVVAFEPVPSTYERLVMCRESNLLPQIWPLPFAVGAATGEAEMWTVRSDSGAASTIQRRSRRLAVPLRVQVRSLDDLQRSHRLPAPQLLKIDVEGSDIFVLQGAVRLLAEHAPMIIFEFNPPLANAAGWQIADAARLLEQFGDYRFFVLGDDRIDEINVKRFKPQTSLHLDVLAVTEHHEWRLAQ